ncbi:MAG: bifunctional phosphoglucose/phosphomannose isomerase [bacterium]|nr:bifunctional phosphoglucose/phosphomannose isomerase [bacterium]
MLRDVINNFNKQFAYKPELKNGSKLKKFERFIVVGMGGSNLVADLLKIWKPDINIIIHRNYGLPQLKRGGRLVILSSYSGNTEEVISSFQVARKEKLPMAVITSGGRLLSLAKKHSVPYVAMSETGIQPRSAVGYSLLALLKIMKEEKAIKETARLAKTLRPEVYEREGKDLAGKLKNRVPVVYASDKNRALALNWKVRFNETSKAPAFYNVWPELNHNEMTGFDARGVTKNLAKQFAFIFLKDNTDSADIKKRQHITQKLYQDRGLSVTSVDVRGVNIWQKIFSSLSLADWTSYYLAENYHVEPEAVPMVEEFKKRMAH